MVMIQTTLGELDESLLIKKTGQEEDDEKVLTWTEYWKDSELVHRSVDMVLKQGLCFGADGVSLV